MNILNLKEKNFILIKVARSLYIFLATPDELEKYVQSNSFDNCIHRYKALRF